MHISMAVSTFEGCAISNFLWWLQSNRIWRCAFTWNHFAIQCKDWFEIFLIRVYRLGEEYLSVPEMDFHVWWHRIYDKCERKLNIKNFFKIHWLWNKWHIRRLAFPRWMAIEMLWTRKLLQFGWLVSLSVSNIFTTCRQVLFSVSVYYRYGYGWPLNALIS